MPPDLDTLGFTELMNNMKAHCDNIDALVGKPAAEQPDLLTPPPEKPRRVRTGLILECSGCSHPMPTWVDVVTGTIEIDTDACECQRNEYARGYQDALHDFGIDPDNLPRVPGIRGGVTGPMEDLSKPNPYI